MRRSPSSRRRPRRASPHRISRRRPGSSSSTARSSPSASSSPTGHENHRLLLYQRPAPDSVSGASLALRPSLELALFWGLEWANYPRTPEALARFRPEQGNQFGRLAPARRGEPAMIVLEGRPVRVLLDSALAVLRRHGVPTSIAP
ncbi:MAG: hypothetical protein ACREON_04610 [Gemmatimonadaceae bacterium]